jgi:hypothetical protein
VVFVAQQVLLLGPVTVGFLAGDGQVAQVAIHTETHPCLRVQQVVGAVGVAVAQGHVQVHARCALIVRRRLLGHLDLFDGHHHGLFLDDQGLLLTVRAGELGLDLAAVLQNYVEHLVGFNRRDVSQSRRRSS